MIVCRIDREAQGMRTKTSEREAGDRELVGTGYKQ